MAIKEKVIYMLFLFFVGGNDDDDDDDDDDDADDISLFAFRAAVSIPSDRRVYYTDIRNNYIVFKSRLVMW